MSETVESVDAGLWLLARLAVHDLYNRRLPKARQQPLWGLELNQADRLEVARLTLVLAEARVLGPRAVR